MNINKIKESNYSILELEGELDALSAIDLDDQISFLLDDGEINLLISLEKLSYISSAGLGVFMSYIKEIETRNCQMILFDLNETVQSTFEILGLHHIITITQTKTEAIARC